ncbi:MAG: hypothetical protein H2058_06400 [Muricauda sp.]|nr:hypothetical protein [Allomuricauda sp.]MBA4744869.1 hypothetical protein [Allomuricauda sp.]
MIDNIKVYPLDKNRFDYQIETKKPVDLISEYDRSTGEMFEYPKKARYKNLELRINKASSYIRGSLHKYHNMDVLGEEHNHNDFSFCQAKEAIENLCNKFYLNPNETKITNLEFGMNVSLGYDPEIFINDNLLMYGFNAHTRHENFKGKGDYKEFKKYSYSFKLYNKSKQFGLDDHILRIEVKITDKRKLNSLGIENLSDLMVKEAYYGLFAFLLEQFDELMIVDSNELKKGLKTPENKEWVQAYYNPNHWKVLKDEVSYKVYQRHIRDFENYGNKMGIFNTKEAIGKLLREKFAHLINCNADCGQKVA